MPLPELIGKSGEDWVREVWDLRGRVLFDKRAGHAMLRVTCGYLPILRWFRLGMGGRGRISGRSWQAASTREVIECASMLRVMMPREHDSQEDLELALLEARERKVRRIPMVRRG